MIFRLVFQSSGMGIGFKMYLNSSLFEFELSKGNKCKQGSQGHRISSLRAVVYLRFHSPLIIWTRIKMFFFEHSSCRAKQENASDIYSLLCDILVSELGIVFLLEYRNIRRAAICL